MLPTRTCGTVITFYFNTGNENPHVQTSGRARSQFRAIIHTRKYAILFMENAVRKVPDCAELQKISHAPTLPSPGYYDHEPRNMVDDQAKFIAKKRVARGKGKKPKVERVLQPQSPESDSPDRQPCQSQIPEYIPTTP